MGASNKTTVRFVNPVPAAAAARLFELLQIGDFSVQDYDGEGVDSLEELPQGPVNLFASDIPLDLMESLVALAESHGFSLLVHGDWQNDYESEITGQILAYDAADQRKIDTWATANTHEPVILLSEALKLDRAELIRRYAVPAVLRE